jgi:hypothetical protein
MWWVLAGGIATLAVAGEPVPAPGLTAEQVVDKNVAARGGLEAWKKVDTMVWIGHIERAQAPSLPFVLQQKRPNKSRFEIKVQNQIAVRIYDGSQGWKLRTGSDGRPDVQAYTSEELSFARDWQFIDGPLMDYAAKGVGVALDGIDDIEGRPAYRLRLSLPSGERHHVWIDAQTFLDVKSDREAHHVYGRSSRVSVHYRDYQAREGLQIPFTIESGGDATQTRDKMVIDKVLLNQPLDDQLFAKPDLPVPRHGIAVGATRSQAARPRGFSTQPPMAGAGATR